MMSDIDVKKRIDQRTVVQILKIIIKAQVDLQTVVQAKAEKFLRELAGIPLSIFTTNKSDHELMKKLSRDILKAWADRRCKELVYKEFINGGP